MKRVLAIVVLSLCAFLCSAQTLTRGSVSALASGGRQVNCVVDFISASFLGMNEQDFSRYETEWLNDKAEVIADFVEEANDKLRKTISLGDYPQANYTVLVKVLTVSKKGNISFDVQIVDKSGDEVAFYEGFYAKGGHIGTLMNLIKDGATQSGENFGARLAHDMKRK